MVQIKKRKFYNPELGTKEEYSEVWKTETVSVRDLDDIKVVNHYWQDINGELWGDFNDPMENIRRSFVAYRERKSYMTPDDIRSLRARLHMTVREFAEMLGIGSSTLTEIENNQRVQVKYQEILFEAVNELLNSEGRLPSQWQTEH